MPFTLVHLSDIHFGQEKGGRVVIHDDVKERLIEDVARVIAEMPNARANGIIVTGDIVYGGKSEQYKEAGKWLDRVAAAAGCAITDIQVVPGNHDIDRSEIAQATEWMLKQIAVDGENKLDSFLAHRQDRELLYARFHSYRPFAEAYSCPLDKEGGTASDRTVKIAPGRSLRFIGLNSALICSHRDEKGHLILGARQRVLPSNPGEELVVLCHHPLDWLHDSDDARRYLRSRARIFISGHEHRLSVQVEPTGENCNLMMLSSGATVPPIADEIYNFTYNVLEFDWDSVSDALCVKVHPRAWSDEAKTFDADPVSLGSKVVVHTLGCPNFRRSPTKFCRDAVITGHSETESQMIEPQAAGMLIDGIQTITEGGEKMSDQYPLLLLRFFRDLSSGQRLTVLVKLGALPSEWQEPLTHSLERRVLDSLKRTGQLDSLEKAMNEVADENGPQGDSQG